MPVRRRSASYATSKYSSTGWAGNLNPAVPLSDGSSSSENPVAELESVIASLGLGFRVRAPGSGRAPLYLLLP
jgi:predicted dienelactone hydrolase